MTHAAEKVKPGRKPVTLCEFDLDYCSLIHPAGAAVASGAVNDTVAAYNRNYMLKTEEYDDAVWNTSNASAATSAEAAPDGSEQVYLIDDTSGAAYGYIYQDFTATFDDVSTLYFFCKYETATKTRIVIEDTTAVTVLGDVEYTWTAGVPSVTTETAGTGGIGGPGSGWYYLYITTLTVVSGNNIRISFYPDYSAAASTNGTYVAGSMWYAGDLLREYQYEDARNGTETNIEVTNGYTGYNTYATKNCIVDATTVYEVVRSHETYLRVTGDATGHGTGVAITVNDTRMCGADPSGEPCYNTYTTCRYTTDFTATTKTYYFAQPRVEIPGSSGYISSLRSASIDPPRISRGDGISVRGSASLSFQDHPHHDRGIDPYVDVRSYTPMNQGTFWGKLLRRNKAYQNRVCRVKTGYIGSTFDATNDFITRTYLIDKIDGPDNDGNVRMTCKDALKLASDERAQAPVANSGILSADLTAGGSSFTITPSGTGNAEYSASGTVRIGSELITFTRSADTFTVVGRAQNNTTAAAHSTGDTVQECLVYDAARIDDILYELIVTYGGVAAGYITFADWTSDVDEWLASSNGTTVISEPTGVWELVNEILEQYMIDLWWDDTAAKIRLKTLQPPSSVPDTVSEDKLIKGSVSVSTDTTSRVSRVWVYHSRWNPVVNLDETDNYRVINVSIDTDAESANEYNDTRVRKIFSRWITSTADAGRLATRFLNSRRDNPRTFMFALDAAESYAIGDYINISTAANQGEDGSNESRQLFILAASDVQGDIAGHRRTYEAVDSAFRYRYGRIAPNGTADYTLASAAEQAKYAFLADATPDMSNGDPPYVIV